MSNAGTPPLLSLPTLKLRSFRVFRDEATLELGPLTLLYGHNQAGKSTLLRTLPLLADLLRPGATALDLGSPALRGASFKELGWMGPEPVWSPRLTVMAPGKEPRPTVTIQYTLDDKGGVAVNRVDIIRGPTHNRFNVLLAETTRRGIDRISARYVGTYRGADWEGELAFGRWIPDGLPEEAEKIAQEVLTSLTPIQRIQWLHANRPADGLVSSRRTNFCLPDGSDLAGALEGRERDVLEPASRWLAEKEVMPNQIAIQKGTDGRPQLVLRSTAQEGLPLNLAGDGIRALLPILLCACWADAQEAVDSPSMLAVEEPEAHLHPQLQISLFDRLVETVERGVPVALETHSVYILRAMQLAILDRRLRPEQVSLNWVSQTADGAASVQRVTVEDDATLKDWRPYEFEQEQELAHRILDERWKRAERP